MQKALRTTRPGWGLLLWLVLLAATLPARAHVGASTVYLQGKAGPYSVYVVVTPPPVIPGQAQVSVFVAEGPVPERILAGANVLTAGPAGENPQGLPLVRVAGTVEFEGTVWVMAPGSWQVLLEAAGPAGRGSLAVPLPATPTRVMRMSRGFGGLLTVLGLILIAGLASVAAAAVREAPEPPGAAPSPRRRTLGRRVALLTVAAAVAILGCGNLLWREQIARYGLNVAAPLRMTAKVIASNLVLSVPAALPPARSMGDLVPDHNHLVHLYAIRWPAMDVAFHLHPARMADGSFTQPLPAVPPGSYKLFADVVHADGFPETALAEVSLDLHTGGPLRGDDAGALLPALGESTGSFALPDGFRFEFTATAATGPAVLHPNIPVTLRFRLLAPDGSRPLDMTPYMGMAGHLAVIKSDGSVFAHIHPDGSVAMAAYMLANGAAEMQPTASAGPCPDTAGFPFGFPSAGTYRLVIQMKHGATIETGAFDVNVY